MGSRNNKQAGSRTERQVVKLIAEALDLIAYNGKNPEEAEIASSRAFSKALDDQGIDIYFAPQELKEVAIQVKEKSCKGKALTVHAENLPDTEGIDVLITKLTRRSKSGRHMPRGMFATLRLDDFLTLLKHYKNGRATRKRRRRRAGT